MEIGTRQINMVARPEGRPSLTVKAMRGKTFGSRAGHSGLGQPIAELREVVDKEVPATAAVPEPVAATGQAIDKSPAVRAEEVLVLSAGLPEAGALRKRAVRAGVPAWAEEVAVAAEAAEVVVAGGGGRDSWTRKLK